MVILVLLDTFRILLGYFGDTLGIYSGNFWYDWAIFLFSVVLLGCFGYFKVMFGTFGYVWGFFGTLGVTFWYFWVYLGILSTLG